MKSKYAYATLLMRNDHYLPGALTLGFLLKTQTRHDVVCLATDRVSVAARSALGLVFDKVAPTTETIVKSEMTGGRKDRDSLMTRFEALRLGPGGGLGTDYEKLILLDADMLTLTGFDELFELPAPAGILLEGKDCLIGYGPDGQPERGAGENGEWHWHRHYGPVCKHGEPIPAEITGRVASDPSNMGVNSAVWRIDPSIDPFCQGGKT